jgi:hypothetical protein
MVAFDRPDADRLSYRQWKEDNIPPRVVIEVLSPSNTNVEMMDKQHFFARFGVEEFIIIDPDKETFTFSLREGEKLVSPDFPPANWQSPSLGIWFRQVEGKTQVFYPDGETPFKTLEESQAEVEVERQRAEAALRKLALLEQKLRDLGELE